nr:MAG TPA: hypothetical protein [Caudoviricetes sp.]
MLHSFVHNFLPHKGSLKRSYMWFLFHIIAINKIFKILILWKILHNSSKCTNFFISL